MKKHFLALFLVILLSLFFSSPVDAHRDGCHRWHSCPSDTGSYVCGDLGYDSECGGSVQQAPVQQVVQEPTAVPTLRPTRIPTRIPTKIPTKTPTPTQIPIPSPTDTPTPTLEVQKEVKGAQTMNVTTEQPKQGFFAWIMHFFFGK